MSYNYVCKFITETNRRHRFIKLRSTRLNTRSRSNKTAFKMFTLKLFLALTTMMMMTTMKCEIFTADFNTPYEFKYFDKTDLPFEEDSIVEPNVDRKRLTKSCSQSEGLLFSGDYVKLSDFVGFNGSLENECQAKLLILFASRELIVDRDLTVADRELRMTFIAPKWHVSGFRKLDLKVETFLGISETIINEKNLIMATSGRSKLNKLIKLGTGAFGTAIFETKFSALKRIKGEGKREVFPPQNSYVVNDYKTLLRQESADKFQHKQIMEWYDELGKDEKVQRHYSAISLVNEFDGLENQFFNERKSNSKINFYHFYQSLLDRIVQYADDNTSSENSPGHIKMYKFLFTAALSKMNVIKNNTEPNLIINIDKYMDMVVKHFKELEKISTDFEKASAINEHNKNYKERYGNKIEEAMNFIKDDITPEIDKISKSLDTQIDELVKETKDKIVQAEEEKKIAEENEKKMFISMIVGAFLSFQKSVAQVVSLLGPVGAAVGATAGAVNSAAESALTHFGGPTPEKLTVIPDGVNKGFKTFWLSIKREQEEKLEKLHTLLNFTETEFDNIGERSEFVGLHNTIAEIRTKAEKMKEIVDYDPNLINSWAEEVKSAAENEMAVREGGGRRRSKRSTNDKNSLSDKKLEQIGKITEKVSVGVVAVINRVISDKKKWDAAKTAVEKAQKKIKILQDYEKEIHAFLVPMIKAMFARANKVTGELEGISAAALDVKRWKIQSALKNVQDNLRKATAGFDVGEDIVKSTEKLEEAMTTMINIYDRIDTDNERIYLANFLTNITSEPVKKITINDPVLNEAVQRLEILIKSYVVINEYDLTLRTLEQWLFPFADQTLGPYQLASKVFKNANKETLDSIISEIGVKVEELKGQFTSYTTAIGKNDAFIKITTFSSKVKPYFKWSNEQFKEEISNLLRGKQISLWADVEVSTKDEDAIKFNEIKFNFKTKNSSAQNSLNEVLDGFKILATHSGNSYYRFDNQTYVFNCESQTIDYSFLNGDDGTPSTTNMVYKKIKEGDIMLSPYTMWKVKLVDKWGKFAQLKPFINDVSIELAGSGTHVEFDTQNTDRMSRYLLY